MIRKNKRSCTHWNLHTNNVCMYVLQQFRVIRYHLNSKCLTSIIVFDIQLRGRQFNKIRQIRILSTPIFHMN